MKKSVKLALAAAVLACPANAYAMPEPVPSVWETLMNRTWAIVAAQRPCSKPTSINCNG